MNNIFVSYSRQLNFTNFAEESTFGSFGKYIELGYRGHPEDLPICLFSTDPVAHFMGMDKDDEAMEKIQILKNLF